MSAPLHEDAARYERYSTRVSLSPGRFWAPRYWPTWLLLALLRVLAALPFRSGIIIGKLLGRWTMRLRVKQRRVAARNIEICFPDMSPEARDRLLSQHAESAGIALIEMAMAWFWPTRRLRPLLRINGREHVDRALADNRAIILLSAHFTPLEIGVRAAELLAARVGGMYRSQTNALADAMVKRGRSHALEVLIDRDNVRQLIKLLKDHYIVFYLADQTHLGNQSELIPFFGEPAVTNVAVTKLARITGATVLPYFFRRLDDDSGYRIDIGPPLESAPAYDRVRDANWFVGRLEDYIREAPAQYFWTYKKFKSRPGEYADPYA